MQGWKAGDAGASALCNHPKNKGSHSENSRKKGPGNQKSKTKVKNTKTVLEGERKSKKNEKKSGGLFCYDETKESGPAGRKHREDSKEENT
ncbi:hypothetical protein [Allofournierella sp.]|uniref:hypothetical protein n=1 Tax=Allofournierella sp. TaxID=1940256 RepID=UPI003AB2F4FF